MRSTSEYTVQFQDIDRYTHEENIENQLGDNVFDMERFLIECRKTKPKVITLANRKRHWESRTNQNSNKMRVADAKRESFSLTFDWMKK